MTTQRTPEQIQADLEQARANVQSTVDDLASRLDPRTHRMKLGLAAAGVIGAVTVVKVLGRLVKRR